MDALKRLREAAAEKRGAAIKRAKDEHIKTARKIAELEEVQVNPSDGGRQRRQSTCC